MNLIQAQKIVERIQNIPLYLHAYAFHLNMRMENGIKALVYRMISPG